MMDGVIQDVRVALRQLARHRAFSAIVLVTLALGIGATATFFSVLNAVAFGPLPFSDPDQLVSVQRARRAVDGTSRMPYATFTELARTTAAVSPSNARASLAKRRQWASDQAQSLPPFHQVRGHVRPHVR